MRTAGGCVERGRCLEVRQVPDAGESDDVRVGKRRDELGHDRLVGVPVVVAGDHQRGDVQRRQERSGTEGHAGGVTGDGRTPVTAMRP
jgi:hypothetical protein